ncbi:DNA alkylation repair protein [Balneola sp. MJW-20]|uniref:DNA alkylation repair protein n=1 Tax=Gracilimonas aurantiaca TaxID=3234185 RepID=UPI00346570E6
MKAKDVINELQQFADPVKATHNYRFFKAFDGGYGEGDEFLGIKVPDQRRIAKQYEKLPLQEVQTLLNNKYHEVRLTASIILTYKVRKKDPEILKEVADFYLRNLSAMNNWDLIDTSSHKILGPYLESKDRSILYELAKSDDLWHNRIAVITCLYFIDRRDFNDALAIAEILVDHKHDLIHKAVGWMLREIGKRDRAAEEKFLIKHYRSMPRTMLRYAIEKFEEPLRQQYLKGKL